MTPFNHLSPDQSWQQANELLASSGSLSDVTLHLENYLRRSRAEPFEPDMLPASEVEAWSLLGRVHAMNEKEDKALAAFEAGRRALDQVGTSKNGAGEMLTVSLHAHSTICSERTRIESRCEVVTDLDV